MNNDEKQKLIDDFEKAISEIRVLRYTSPDEELKAFVNAMTPEQMQETMEKFRAFMPQHIINYNEVGRKLVEVQPMPEGATPYYLEHTFGKKGGEE